MKPVSRLVLAVTAVIVLLIVSLPLAGSAQPPQGSFASGLVSRPLSAGLSAATISLSPPSLDVSIGQVFTLDVVIQVDAGAVGADAYINFNAARLSVVDAAGDPAHVISADTSSFSLVFLNDVNASTGQIGFASGSFSPVTGTFRIAQIRFKALAAGTTSVVFNRESPRNTDVSGLSGSLLTGASDAQVVIAAGSPTVTGTATRTATSITTTTPTPTSAPPTSTATQTPAATAAVVRLFLPCIVSP